MNRSLFPLVLSSLLSLGCTEVVIESTSQSEGESSAGDGDGDGDGDSDSASESQSSQTQSGDGDGDGDGDSGGDGDPAGDGDGDQPPGDGDGDPPPDGPPANVLILGDGGTDEVVQASLEAANHSVTLAGAHWEWDGMNPNPENFDVVVLLEADEYETGLGPMADASLASYVEGGGQVIRTEWANFRIGLNPVKASDIQMPVVTETTGFAYSSGWSVDMPNHPLAAGVPAMFVPINGGCTEVVAKPGAVVVFSNEDCGPALSVREIGQAGGRMLHINDDLGADLGDTGDPNILQLFVNSVGWMRNN